MTGIPLGTIFADPVFARPRLSPDGLSCAYLSNRDGVLNIWVRGADGRDRRLTDDRRQGIRAMEWVGGGRAVIFPVDTDGDENFVLHTVDVIGDAGVRALTPVGCAAELVAVEPARPDTIVVAINDVDPARHDLYTVDLPTGRRELVAVNPGYVQWLVDGDLALRGGVAPTADGGWQVEIDGAVRLPVPAEDAGTTSVIGFTSDGRRLVMLTSVGRETVGVALLDCATGELSTIAADDEFDVEEVFLDPITRRPVLAQVNAERPRSMVVDGAEGGCRLPDCDGPVWPVHSDASGDRWLLRVLRDTGPSSYLVLDRTGSGTVEPVGVDRPWLTGHRLQPMQPFSFRARDGLLVRGYRTSPAAAAAPPPAVLLVHGGPWDRVSWGLDAEAQWLADRGYACIQVNFRGSTGYGKGFVNAGDREWGGRMHTDLLDAIDRLAADGALDPTRVAIMGASYGGYAALVGAAFTAGRFACAIDAFGPSNLDSLLRSLPPYWAPTIEFWHRRVGDPDRDADFLAQRSPLHRADRIGIPLLIAQGRSDPRVQARESEQIVAAARAAGIPVDYLAFADEGHGFNRPANRLAFYRAVEEFLFRHLPVDAPLPSAVTTTDLVDHQGV